MIAGLPRQRHQTMRDEPPRQSLACRRWRLLMVPIDITGEPDLRIVAFGIGERRPVARLLVEDGKTTLRRLPQNIQGCQVGALDAAVEESFFRGLEDHGGTFRI